jgi:hypothetical protein
LAGSRSRDVLLVFGCLVTSGSTILFLWAGIADGITNVWIGVPSGPISSGIFLAVSAAFLAACFAGILLLRRNGPKGRKRGDLLPLIALLSLFALLEVTRLMHPDEGTLLLSAVQLNIIPQVILWIYYRRPGEGDAVLVIGSWFAALLATRPVMSFILGNIVAPRAAIRTQIFVAAEKLLFAVLCLLPLAMMSSALRTRLKAWRESLARFDLALRLGNLLVGGLAIWAALQFSESATHILVSAVATQGFLISLFVIALIEGSPRSEAKGSEPGGSRRREAIFRAALLVVCLGYVLTAIRVATNFRVDVYNDTLSYLSIARQYAEGTPVIRGYWSPLISWLVAPLLRFGAEPYAALHAVSIVIGLAWILASVYLVRLLGLGHGLQLAVACSVSFLIVGQGLGRGAPDMAGALFLAAYFCVLLRSGYLARPIRNGLLAGALGALAYLGKQYNLFFALVHLVLTHGLRIASGAPRKPTMKALASAVVTLLAFTLPWAVVLSLRYHRLTFSTAAPLNHAIVGPRMMDHPCNHGMLCPEPEDVLFPWEDPAAIYYPDLGWSPLASLSNLRHQLWVIANNVEKLVPDSSFFVGVLPALGLLGVGLLALEAWLERERRFSPAWMALTAVLYVSGYLFFPAGLRYFLPVFPLLFAGVYLSVARIVPEDSAGAGRLRGAVASLGAVMAVTLAMLAMARPPVLRYLLTETSPFTCLETDSLALAGMVEAPLAGTDASVLHVAFFTRTRTVGWLRPDTPADLADNELRADSVRTFLVPEDSGLAADLIRDYGYARRGSAVVCEETYLILVPPPGP